MSKLNWLDKFAEEQSKKMKKTASFKRCAEQIIVDQEDVPGAIDGQELSYKNELYKVLNANFQDEMGPGVVLEKISKTAEFDGEVLPQEMSMEMGTDVAPETPVDTKKVTDAPEKAVQPDQGNAGLHIEVRDTVEVDKFYEEAAETEKQIAEENAIDRTVPEGKYNRIERRIQQMVPTEVPAEDVETVETFEEEVPVEEVETEETFEEEVPTEEVPEEVVEEETSNEEDPEECKEEEKQVFSNRILSKIFNK